MTFYAFVRYNKCSNCFFAVTLLHSGAGGTAFIAKTDTKGFSVKSLVISQTKYLFALDMDDAIALDVANKIRESMKRLVENRIP